MTATGSDRVILGMNPSLAGLAVMTPGPGKRWLNAGYTPGLADPRGAGRVLGPHQPAALAQKNGLFDCGICPVQIPQRTGDPIEFREDEGIRRDTTVDSLAKLRPAFTKDGTITAGSSSQMSDGAAAVVVMSKAKA